MKELIEFDSLEEKHFSDYCEQLMQEGYIVEYTNDFPAFILYDDYNLNYISKLKTKDKDVKVKLINKCTYKPDFKIQFTDKAKSFFNIDMDNPVLLQTQKIVGQSQLDQQLFLSRDNICYVEIKPVFAHTKNTSNAQYKIIRKWVQAKHGVFVNTVKPLSKKGLFANTFTSDAYYNRFHKKTGKRLNINWEYKSLNDYIDEIKSKIK